MSLLNISGVTKVFGTAPVRALPLIAEGCDRATVQERTGQVIGVAEVSFAVEAGEIVVVMGLSGSGKSTIIRCLNRLIEPTAGEILLEGQDICGLGPDALRDMRRTRMAMVFQRFALFPHLTVLANAAYGLEVNGVSRPERERRAAETLEMVGLGGHWAGQYPDALSGGMQQRVGLARALTVDPDIILMDEAFSALDPLIRKDMQQEILRLQRRLGKTVVFITHDLDEAINIGDRIVLMKDGRVVQIGTAEDILQNPASRYVERFVEDVDPGKVLTAGSVMKRARDVAHHGDGARAILLKCKGAGLSSLYVVDSDGCLVGLVQAAAAAAALEEGRSQARAGDLMDGQPQTVRPDAPLRALLPLMASDHGPVAVTGADGQLQGVVVVGALLEGLSEGQAEAVGPEGGPGHG